METTEAVLLRRLMLLQLVLDDDDGRAALRDHVLTIQFSFSLPEHFVNLYFSHAPVQLNVYYGVSWRIWTLTWSRCYTTGGRCCCCLIATQHIVAEAWVGWDWLRRSHNLLLRLKFALLSLLVAHYVDKYTKSFLTGKSELLKSVKISQ